MPVVTLKLTGDVWARLGTGRMTFEFEGETLGDLLDALFQQVAVRDLLLDENGKTRPRSRMLVNGRFADTLQGLETPVRDGDLVVLMRPALAAS